MIPIPKESTVIHHIIAYDLPQLINHIKDMRSNYPWRLHLYEQAHAVVDQSLWWRSLINGQLPVQGGRIGDKSGPLAHCGSRWYIDAEH
eukprot:15033108-Ditylum_brightwellii.AAC.1